MAVCAFGLALLNWVSVLSYDSLLRAQKDQHWVMHTHLVLQKLDDLLEHLISAEAGESGYLQTEDKSYLASCRATSTPFEDLNQIGQLTSDNPSQQQTLQQLNSRMSNLLSEFQDELAVGGKKGVKTNITVRSGVERQSLLEIASRHADEGGRR